MLENERQLGDSDDKSFVAIEQCDGSFFLRQFEERLAKLQPYPDSLKMARRFATDAIKLYPHKFTSAILWRHDGVFDILIGDNTSSGYRQLDHQKIFQEYNIDFDTNTYLSFIMTAGNKRYMITSSLENIIDRDIDTLIATLKRYQIAIAFSSEFADPLSTPGYALKSDPETTIAIGNYGQVLDELIYDDWTRQIAEFYDLTIREWLRFRVAKELPASRKPRHPF